MKLIFVYFVIFFSFFIYKAKATHIIGGELSYACKGNNNYEITFKFYRDCDPGNALFDTLVRISVFDQIGNYIDIVEIKFPDTIQVPAQIIDKCFVPPPDICVSQAIYKKTVNLPPIAGGYVLTFQRCCRNNTISNIFDPTITGFTCTINIPDSVISSCNSSPVFKEFPPTFLCAGNPIIFDHSAIDADGDSLVYELCTPYLGATQNDPAPLIAQSPPYFEVAWANNYSVNYQIAARDSLKIDSKTGLLTCTPNSDGQFVVGICVKEFRKGILLSENKRDFQFNVVICDGSISVNKEYVELCEGTSVNLNARGFTDFKWSPPTGLDTTKGANVIAAPSKSIVYTVVGTNFSGCSDTVQVEVNVLPVPSVSAFAYSPRICMGDSTIIKLKGASNFVISPDSSAFQLDDSTFILFPIVTTDYKIEGKTGICSDFLNVRIGVNTLPGFNVLVSKKEVCKGDTIELEAKGNYSFTWFPAAGLSATTGNKLLANPIVTTTYTVEATDGIGCKRQLVFTIEVLLPAKARFVNTVSIGCAPFRPPITNVSLNSDSYEWFLNGNLVSVDEQPKINLPSPGKNYTLMLIATNKLFCNFDTISITLSTFPEVSALTVPSEFRTCNGPSVINFTNTSFGYKTFLWDFGDGTTSIDDFAPSHFYSIPGTYKAKFIAKSPDGCLDSIIHIIRIGTDVNATFTPSATIGCGIVEVKFNNNATNSVSQTWEFDDGSTSSDFSPSHVFPPRDEPYSVKLTSVNEVGCESAYTYPIPLKVFTIPIVSFLVDDTTKTWPEKTFTFNNTSNFKVSARRWDFGDGTFSLDIDPIHEYEFAGTYIVSLTETDSNGCDATVKVKLVLDDSKGALWVPSAFAPRSSTDKLRTFIPLGYGLKTYKLEIFTSQGDLIFTSDAIDKLGSPEVAWDATINGIPAAQGVYIWKIEASYFNGTLWKGMPDLYGKFKQIGTVTIIR